MKLGPTCAALALLVLAGTSRAKDPKPDAPLKHTSRDPLKCAVCRPAYDRALERVRDQLRRSTFPVKMIAGWLFLADGRHPKDLEACIDAAIAWKSRGWRERSHPGNWYPALAGAFLVEVQKHRPERRIETAIREILAHFQATQETTGGWYKWHEGALKERLDYPTVDLGFVSALAMTTFVTARAQDIRVPPETMRRGLEWVARLTSDRGLAYGTSRSGRPSGGEKTGGRGAHLAVAMAYAGMSDDRFFTVYRRLLPTLLPNLDQGHHVGALHGLSVVLGCHVLGPRVYRQLTDLWLDRLIRKQEEDGGLYIGDDGDAGGEKGLLRGNVGSTAAFALMILLQDHDRLVPKDRGRNPRDGALTMDTSRRLRRNRAVAEDRAAAETKRRADAEARRTARDAAAKTKKVLAREAPAWNDRLVARVHDALESGSTISFRCAMLKREATVRSTDPRGRFVVEASGGASLSLAPGRLSYAERAEIAAAVVRDGSAEDHCLAAFFALAANDVAAGKAHLAKGGAGAVAVEALFRRIGRLD